MSPHIITIKEDNYLIFNGSDKVFINEVVLKRLRQFPIFVVFLYTKSITI